LPRHEILFFLVAAILLELEGKALTAQEEEFFSEAEVFQALSWGMPDSEARRLAMYMSDDPAVAATAFPDLQGQGATARMCSDDMLTLLSLVSVETNRKVERYIEERRLGGAGWSSEKRAAWEARRAEIREALIKDGKIKPEP
jgi:hypothetical protein